MYVNERECQAAGLDTDEVRRIARGLSKYGKQASAIGIEIFGGGSGSGEMRFRDDHNKGCLKVASIDGWFNGGDGGDHDWGDGLIRGE